MKQDFHFVRIDPGKAPLFAPLCRGSSLDDALRAGPKGLAAGLTDAGGTPVAAAVGQLEPEALWISSLMVDPAFRGRGAGIALLNGMIALAAKARLTTVYLEYAMPQQRELETFLMAHRFQIDNQSGQIYRCPMEQLRQALSRHPQPRYKGELLPISQLPPQQRTQLRALIPDQAAAPGKLVPAACLVNVVNRQPAAFALCRSSPMGSTATLDTLHLQPGAVNAGPPLVYAALSQLAQGSAETFAFVAAAPAEMKMMEHLGSYLDLEWETEKRHMAIYTRKGGTHMYQIDWEQDGISILLPRLNALQDFLDTQEIESRQVLTTGQLPYLEFEEGGLLYQMKYVALGEENEGRYLLNLNTRLPLDPALSEAEAETQCLMANYASLGPVAYFDRSLHAVVLHASMPDAGAMPEPEVLTLFLDLFRDAIARFLPEEEAPQAPDTDTAE